MASGLAAACRHLGVRRSIQTWRAAEPSRRLTCRAQSSLQTVAPQSIDEFDIDFSSPLGYGAIGTVYSGQHRTTAREVAIKAVPSVLTERDDIQANLETGELSDSIIYETRAFTQMIDAGFSNPHVVDCIACFEGSGEDAVMLGLDLPDNAIEEPLHYFVMERLDTDTLQCMIEKKKPVSEQDACTIIRAVCQGLLHLHESGIVHRDIKPGNIMLREGRVHAAEVKLIDFSHAGVSDDLRRDIESARMFTKKVGTPGYVAPEILTQKEAYSSKCDVYSVGATLHSMLSQGRLPRRHPRLGIVTSMPDSVSKECSYLTTSMLSLSPEDRPTVTEILAHPWMAE